MPRSALPCSETEVRKSRVHTSDGRKRSNGFATSGHAGLRVRDDKQPKRRLVAQFHECTHSGGPVTGGSIPPATRSVSSGYALRSARTSGTPRCNRSPPSASPRPTRRINHKWQGSTPGRIDRRWRQSLRQYSTAQSLCELQRSSMTQRAHL